jgi:hypothetical protein
MAHPAGNAISPPRIAASSRGDTSTMTASKGIQLDGLPGK